MATILKVEKRGLAKKAGIKVGEKLLAINNQPFCDILDYYYAEGQWQLTLTVADTCGDIRQVSIEKKDYTQTLGLEFGSQLEITPKSCHNKCVFCFVDQLPCGMRETLYIKDDDYRLSFSSGSYITCTNLTDNDIDRILKYKLSPLYLSVHATDHATRLKLMGIKRGLNQMELMQKFVDSGIKINAQVVLVGGVNDGEMLKKTLTDLKSLGENLLSVAVVPVGLTAHRANLAPLKPLTKKEAIDVIDIVENYYNKYPYFCYCSDEMYQIAEREIKDYDYYGNFEQIENGVGLVAKFLWEIADQLDFLDDIVVKNKRVAIITGVSGYNTMQKATQLITNKWTNVQVNIYPIKNNFFGQTVTVSGLVTATDIMEQLKNVDLSSFDKVLIPSVMLREFEDVFLDNISLKELEKNLKCKISVTAVDGDCLVDTIIAD